MKTSGRLSNNAPEKAASRELTTVIQKLQNLHSSLSAESIINAIIFTDMEYKIVGWNKRAEKLYGWKAREVIGKNATEILQGKLPNGESAQSEWEKAIFLKGHYRGQIIHKVKKGNPVAFLIKMTLVKGKKGNPIGIMAHIRDITELKTTETKLQKALAMRDNFISIASHELKTPLTSLKLYIDTFKNQAGKKENKEFSKYINKMDDQINKLTALINDLLNVSKIQHGKLDYRMEEFDINELIGYNLETFREVAKKHKIIVRGKITKKVIADRYRIYQVLTNLLTNAIKYSPAADKIVLKLSQDGGKAVVSVQDFGIGIDKKHQKRIFEQFYRVNNPKTQSHTGLGMGLFIVNQIIKRHRGELSITSSRGKGSVFSFTLPLK